MTRLRTLGLLLAGLLVSLPLAPAGAWSTAQPTARSTAQSTSAPDPDRPATWGRTKSADHVLRRGCHPYRYRYAVTPPTDEWAAEIFLFNPKGRRVGSAYYLRPQDVAHGQGTWTLCTTSTGPGRYTMRMKVTYDRYGINHTGWAQPSRFRMTRP